MLSDSPAKIHDPPVTGVSPRPTDQRGARKTAKHESTCRVPERGHRGWPAVSGCRPLGSGGPHLAAAGPNMWIAAAARW